MQTVPKMLSDIAQLAILACRDTKAQCRAAPSGQAKLGDVLVATKDPRHRRQRHRTTPIMGVGASDTKPANIMLTNQYDKG